MNIAVVIVVYRNHTDVLRCLEAVVTQDYPDFNIVIVENGGSTDAKALEALLHVRFGADRLKIVWADNPGFAGGVNHAMAASPDADAWWILNPDTVPQPSALSALASRLARGDVQAVGGIVRFPDGRIQGTGGVWRSLFARARSLRDLPDTGGDRAAAVEAQQNYLLGTSMLVSRAFLRIAGPIREDYFLYAEEIEWFLRGRKRGARLGFAPDAEVIHYHGTTTGIGLEVRQRPKLPIYLDERNKLHVVRDTDPLLLPVAAAVALGWIGLRFAARGAFAQAGYALSGWRAGLRNERGKPRWIGAPPRP